MTKPSQFGQPLFIRNALNESDAHDALMERTLVRLSALALIFAVSTGAFAQTPAPVPTPPPVQTLPLVQPSGQTAQQDAMRADRRACADEQRGKNLPRAERRAAMRSCMIARNPDYKARAELGASRQGDMRQVRDTCRTETDSQRLTGPERREAMKNCIIAKKPEMAKPMACMEEARAKGLKERSERRTFIRTCMKG